MTPERAAEIFFVVNFAVVGISHVVRPRVWVEFFFLLRERGHVGVFLNGMLSLMVGSIIVAFHNVWTGVPMVVTIVGWMQVVKGLASLAFPAAGMKGLMRVSMERAWEIQAGGAVFLVLCAVVVWSWR
jgi:hypothetical protein